ncbi:hypothetical protein [Leifsonia sp. LS-T14]|uniref:hypothetical protein n=1 Tax=unclassified Leifsonia TaxID=2663824 RepID=UPI0035A7295D
MLAVLSTVARSGALGIREKVDGMIVRYDAWFLVLLAVLMVLAFVIASALAIWCITNGKGRFSGSWKWNQSGVNVWVECR